MNIPKVTDILNKKIAEIQARLPVKLNVPSNNISFSEALDLESAALDNAVPIIPKELLTISNPVSNSRYPLVSGSYESVYPRLSQTQINELLPRIEGAINTYADQFGLDPKLVRAVIKNESGFQPFALSTSGAMGLMQLMPGTAEGLGVVDVYNIEQNIKGGTQYLSYQLKAFDNDLKLALAAYNAGPNSVRKFDGIPPYEQTQNYVKKVLNSYEMYKSLGDN